MNTIPGSEASATGGVDRQPLRARAQKVSVSGSNMEVDVQGTTAANGAQVNGNNTPTSGQGSERITNGQWDNAAQSNKVTENDITGAGVLAATPPETPIALGPCMRPTYENVLNAIPDGGIETTELKDLLRRRFIATDSTVFNAILDMVAVRSSDSDVVFRRLPILPATSAALASPSTAEPALTMEEVKAKPPWLAQPGSTVVLQVKPEDVGDAVLYGPEDDPLEDFDLRVRDNTVSAFYMREAAARLQTSNVPVAFPTETVYGLAADATRSEAVQGIYKAKQRPSDNPLIVHVCCLSQLRGLLEPGLGDKDPIPQIYGPLIKKFWPGPLTVILPNPENSKLAPEVTAGLRTFGARMPKSLLALMLIWMAGAPLAAPSANASTKPSPTTAQHVKYDLEGRIDLILDGGPCNVGVESTVVDGLSDPPAILRPGGVSIEQIRACPGWENVVIGYKDSSEEGLKPKAPGMKYKHYSPKAKVILYETNTGPPDRSEILQFLEPGGSGLIGLVTTKYWSPMLAWNECDREAYKQHVRHSIEIEKEPHRLNPDCEKPGALSHSESCVSPDTPFLQPMHLLLCESGGRVNGWKVDLGHNADDIARALFAALRELDANNVQVIMIEGIDDKGDVAAAVMNRLRKAAEVQIKSPTRKDTVADTN